MWVGDERLEVSEVSRPINNEKTLRKKTGQNVSVFYFGGDKSLANA